MKRWGLWILLVLSLGVNVGVLLTLAVGGWPATQPAGDPETPTGAPGAPAGPRGEIPATADGVERSRPGGRGLRMLELLADRMELEGERREHFIALQRSFLETAGEARWRRLELQGQLRREITGPAPDRQRIGELIDQLSGTQGTLERSLAELVLETRELLQPAQERQYLAFLERLRRRLDGPGFHHPGRPPRPGTSRGLRPGLGRRGDPGGPGGEAPPSEGPGPG